MRLVDPWFEARFLGETNAHGHKHKDSTGGVFLWCPCAYGHDERAHGLIISFENPRNAPAVPDDSGSRDRNGVPKRWTMSGTGLADLTLSPSVDVGAPSCWHGFITNGEVT